MLLDDVMHVLFQVEALMDTLAREYAHVTVVDGGRSFEGRPIRYLRISTTNFQVMIERFLAFNLNEVETSFVIL